MTTPDLSAADPARTAPGVQVVAHRGSSAALPEHTLAAYRRALTEGADAVECDVRLTRDRQLVCVHDRTIARVSDGGRKVVSTLTLAELAAHDFGSWKPVADEAPAGPGRPTGDGGAADPERHSVLRLESLLELVADCGRRVDLAIETKHPVRYRGAVEAELVRMLRRFGIQGAPAGEGDPARPHARLMSFSGLALGRLRDSAPEFPRVFLFEHPSLLRLWPGAGLPAGAVIAGPGIELVRRKPELVTRLRAAGHRVHVWTVDRPEDVALCLELGVEAIITNRPRDVLDQLGR
ncbi:glycerophosphodiester phosphodiesterase family protein [Kitasatospora sp. NBC_01287]|uniref:glycerophosphodiester phosphodiesterase family protein n=1 Tax=Kitasatospora sp. NBC_01287 TaxID=2903573 RepID=UPI00225322BA|nr:glycerophosphodiester phosphodiesterase family protein [Kitasatospora sp. NBC_01287]MCX4747913.1 glycerophosphodiester phosphodiesterase family protein [Kitasatospora sp. NBC_01287]